MIRHGKYGVSSKIERTYADIVFRSKAEARYAKWLDVRCRAKDSKDRVSLHGWQYEPKRFSLTAGLLNIEVGHYTPDFRVVFNDDETGLQIVEWHEVKGVMTIHAARWIRVFRACYPELTLRIIDAATLQERGAHPRRPTNRQRMRNRPVRSNAPSAGRPSPR